MFKKTVLNNGLRIITVPQKSTQAVTVLVLVGTGSKYEKKETNGISHFLEHMFFKGTKKRPTTVAIAETLDRVGGIYNAFTGEEYTGYFAKVDSSHLDMALDWVSDVYFNSLLPEKEIEREKGVIIQEINMYKDHPMSYVGILWSKLLYGDQPAGWPISGTKESVSKIYRQDLISYMKKQYVASNTIVCVSGNIEIQKTLGKIKRYFSKIKTVIPFKKPQVFDASVNSASITRAQRRVEAKKTSFSSLPSLPLRESSVIEYFSFLRPLYEIQIAKLFGKYPKYFPVFLSCNEAYKTASGTKLPAKKWCGKCSKCLFVFTILYPFLGNELIKIFNKNLFEDKTLLPVMEQLIGERGFKPFECIGTKKESLIAFYLSWKKYTGETRVNLPYLLEYFEKKILPRYLNLEKESKKILNSWNNHHNLPKEFEKTLRDAVSNEE